MGSRLLIALSSVGCGRPLRRLGRAVHEFRAIFEMHRVIVGPLPAPDKTVPLEDVDNLGRYRVGGLAAGPEPIIGIGGIDVDRRTPGVHARLPGIRHSTAVISARRWIDITLCGSRKRI